MKNADMPAMPLVNENGAPVHHSSAGMDNEGVMFGLTKREMMAMHMMAAMLVGTEDPNSVYCAAKAIDAVDQLIFQLDRTKGESK